MNEAPEPPPVAAPLDFEEQPPDHSNGWPFDVNDAALFVLLFDWPTVTTWFGTVVVILA